MKTENILNVSTKIIIALQGQDKTGKTETLKMLIKKLEATAKIIACESKFTLRMKNAHWDVWAIFEHKGKIIAITSRGDAEHLLKNDFDTMENYAKQHGVEIEEYICAIHTSGKTVHYAINKAAKIGAQLRIFGKSTYYDSPSLNTEKMQNQINQYQSDILFANI